ncbi:hypothetical protein Dimus_013047, partial [Dionaea muscipula]
IISQLTESEVGYLEVEAIRFGAGGFAADLCEKQKLTTFSIWTFRSCKSSFVFK